jgi:hypothetical protein
MTAVALGFRAHSGWTSAVAVAGSPAKPAVLVRTRIELASPSVAGSKQPYHAAEPLEFADAEALIRGCRESSLSLAGAGLHALIAQVAALGHPVVGAGIVFAAGRALPDLAAILKSHALIHTAEGEFFRDVLLCACEHCSLPVTRIKERDAPEAKAWARIDGLGKSLGPPWTRDQKLASLAAWMALAAQGHKW